MMRPVNPSPRLARKATIARRRSIRASLWHDSSLPSSLVERLWNDPDQLIAHGSMLKDGDRCTVVRFDHDGRSMVLKRFNLKDQLHTAVHMLMRSRARWCWSNALALHAAGVPTPRPLACLDERRAGLLRRRSF